jgi:hypothetical protein
VEIICQCTGMYIEVEKNEIFEIFEREIKGRMGRIYMKVGLHHLSHPKESKESKDLCI